MSKLPKIATRAEVLKFICSAASYGNLGLFVGAGLSKAVLNAHSEIALSWGQLLHQVSEKLGVNYSAIARDGASYPEIASRICEAHAASDGIPFPKAVNRLKSAIAELTCWYPSQDQRERYSNYLRALSPAWIITTNYDLVIEAILTGTSVPLGPADQLISRRDVVPVYHLHGRRTNPRELIIVQEDYVSLFRPNEYRQIKLALTVKESTTLILGYALGDVNVLTALDWSENVFESSRTNYPHEVIQIIWKATPQDKPYRDKNGIVIIETNELASFFEDYLSARKTHLVNESTAKQELDKLTGELNKPRASTIEKFIDDLAFRKVILTSLSIFPVDLIGGFISFLDKCIEETWKRAKPKNAFEAYDQNLAIILDILTAFNTQNIPPALFHNVAYALNRVAFYVGRKPGESWAAAATWDKRKGELTKEMVTELRSIAGQHDFPQLRGLLDSI